MILMDSLSTHTDYGTVPLSAGDLDPDPIAQFARWLGEADAGGFAEPNAMVLGTIDDDGMPSSRTVLLRRVRAEGLEFFTNYDSRKGRALAGHPVATAVFPWYGQQRQVIVTGSVTRLDAESSDAYFASRPRDSQIASAASRQSQPIESRELLEQRIEELALAYPEGTAVPRPANWGGFLLSPIRIEFWKGRSSRVHDRFVYDRHAEGWGITRLQP
ncbi:pyridoxamine 5'-phosphate oxidase [Subtercola frigoramans]|nr:pyridoxamine 5'-phosphate oxidase [Subtercola frigoramans]